MKKIFFVSFLSLALLGAGCLGGKSASSSVGSGGVWLTVNSGKTWTGMNTLPTASGVSTISGVDVLSLERDPSNDKTLYLGTAANGLLYSLDGGMTWLRPPDAPELALVRTGAVIDIEVDPQNLCTFYVLKTDRLMKTNTCGRTFETATYVETRTDEELTAFAIDWYNPKNLWLGGTAGDVLHSTDGGETWSAAQRIKDDVTAIQVSNADSRVILVGTARRGVSRSADGGATWTSLEDSVKQYDKADRVHGFAQNAKGTLLVMNTDYGLLKSADNGATWASVPLVTGQGQVDILTLAVAPEDAETIVYGTSAALYRSVNGGAAWTTQELPTARAASVIAWSPFAYDEFLLGVKTVKTQ